MTCESIPDRFKSSTVKPIPEFNYSEWYLWLLVVFVLGLLCVAISCKLKRHGLNLARKRRSAPRLVRQNAVEYGNYSYHLEVNIP